MVKSLCPGVGVVCAPVIVGTLMVPAESHRSQGHVGPVHRGLIPWHLEERGGCMWGLEHKGGLGSLRQGWGSQGTDIPREGQATCHGWSPVLLETAIVVEHEGA